MGQNDVYRITLPNDETLAYRHRGTGGPTILLIHGNLVSSRHWGYLTARLGEHARVYALDLRGAGFSTYCKPVESFRDWSEDIRHFCDALELTDFVLVGWSMGGGICQRFVVDHAGYAKKLVLLASIPPTGYSYRKRGPAGEQLNEFYLNKEELLTDPSLKVMIDALEQNNRSVMRYLWDTLVFNVKKPDAQEYEELVDDIFRTRNLREAAWAAHSFNISHVHNGVVPGSGEVDKIHIPVLVLCGENDAIIPVAFAQKTVDEIGENAMLVPIKNAGHALHYDEPETVARRIRDFSF